MAGAKYGMEVGSSQKHLAFFFFFFFSGVAIEGNFPPFPRPRLPRPTAAPVTSFAINEDRKGERVNDVFDFFLAFSQESACIIHGGEKPIAPQVRSAHPRCLAPRALPPAVVNLESTRSDYRLND